MTPERLAELREWMTCDPSERKRSADLSVGQVQELLDLVDSQREEIRSAEQAAEILADKEWKLRERLATQEAEMADLRDEILRHRGEIADLLSRLDAAAFGATQVHNALKAADELRDMARAHFAANRLVCFGHAQGADAIVAYDVARAKTL